MNPESRSRRAARSDVAPLRRVLLMHPRSAFGSQSRIDAQWESLRYAGRPDFGKAVEEYDDLVELLCAAGVDTEYMQPDDGLTLDAVYVRDASVVADGGAILCNMGKVARSREPEAHRAAFEQLGVPILGRIGGGGLLEGGDVVWIDTATLAVGEGYRTNAEGIRQLREIVGSATDVVAVPLPHWKGSGDVFHLMSILSPLDDDLALVYSPLMPVRFRDMLRDRGYGLIEVPDDEMDMGPNALALSPRRCVLEVANVETRRRLETAGVEVLTYDGAEISRKGLGGPTCLTRPLERSSTGS